MILHGDFSTGAAGDKLLGALLEIGEHSGHYTFERLYTVAAALIPSLVIERDEVRRCGVMATHLSIHEISPTVRTWQTIRAMIEQGGCKGILSAGTVERSLRTFDLLAQAEARVHGVALDAVHFHEVGAADSIVDIVGSCLLLDALSVDHFFATPLALGSGTVVCSHGTLPVPAPATAALVEGIPVYEGTAQGELTTPTGAALLKANVTVWGPLETIVPQAIGYGAGSRDLQGYANVVRMIYGARNVPCDTEGQHHTIGVENPDQSGFSVEGCVLFETNIDHLAPEEVAFVCEELLAQGAFDVWQQSITMKKGRLAVVLSALTAPGDEERFARSLSSLTGSLGVRRRYVERTIAPRVSFSLETPYGTVPYKAMVTDSPIARFSWVRPEHESVARIARELGVDYHMLQKELTAYGETAGRRQSDTRKPR